MAFVTGTPTHPRQVMLTVIAALTPGALALLGWYGLAALSNLVVAAFAALITEMLALRLRRRASLPTVLDGSALLTGLLLGLALPPGTPWGIVALAAVIGVGLGKHAYGGIGQNVFNPAVVGYTVVLVSFPAALANWPEVGSASVDALSGATALSAFRYREGMTVPEVWLAERGFGAVGGFPAEWISLAFLAGGLFLVWRRLAAWRVAAAFLGTLGLLGLAGYDNGSSRSLGSPFLHWFSGGTMLAAWFFLTDPVTHPASRRGQLWFGALVGVVTWVIRSFGSYPDGIAFGILLANGATAWLDRPERERPARTGTQEP
ncbi:MAG TPA: electron transport complex subunit RsxD [Gammaproteobacteria bacterium]|jgi:electron transport complex protein RnfD|nr:electron transport complex subunit RsxD [Gammaproteobacteria bacterium]